MVESILAGVLIGLIILWISNIQQKLTIVKEKLNFLDIHLAKKQVYELSQYETGKVKKLLDDVNHFVNCDKMYIAFLEVTTRIEKIEQEIIHGKRNKELS